MSLASDFHMYYNETFVGYINSEGVVCPFYVTNVVFDSNADLGRDDHDPQLTEHLIFQGHDVINDEDEGYRYSQRNRSIPIHDLILDMPKLGYYNAPGDGNIWISYNPQRSTKKGFTFRRTTYRVDGNSRRLNLVCNIFKDTRSDFERNFLFVRDRGFQRIMYKGANIGRLNHDNTLRLHPDAEVYLRDIINEGLEARNANTTE